MPALPLIVFDVNETLLDLQTMEPTFERIFGDRADMRLWFVNLILYSAALTVAGCYVPSLFVPAWKISTPSTAEASARPSMRDPLA